MRKFLPIFPLILSLVVRVHAESPVSFEAALTGVHAQAKAARAEQLQEKSRGLSEQIRKTAVSVQAMTRGIQNLPNFIFDLRARSGDPHDPRLGIDVNNLVDTLSLLRRQVDSFLSTTRKLHRLANKDMDLRTPAMDLARVSNNLANKLDLVKRELDNSEGPLRRAGFDAQVQALMGDGRLLSSSSVSLAAEAMQLYTDIVSR